MHFVGIDPGKKGYVAAYDPATHRVSYSRLIFDKNNTLDHYHLRTILDGFSESIVFMEKIKGRGGWGATQLFNMGFLYGQVYSVVTYYPHRMVTPQTWQNVIHASIKKSMSAKEKSQAAYKQLFPKGGLPESSRGAIEDNLLDAFLIAIYGALIFGKVGHVTINGINPMEKSK